MDWAKIKSDREYTIRSYIVIGKIIAALAVVVVLATIPGLISIAFFGWRVGVYRGTEVFSVQVATMYLVFLLIRAIYNWWQMMKGLEEET